MQTDLFDYEIYKYLNYQLSVAAAIMAKLCASFGHYYLLLTLINCQRARE